MRLWLVLLAMPALCACADLFSFNITREIPEERVVGSGIGSIGQLLGDVPIQIDLAAEQSARSLGPLGEARLSAASLSITATGRNGASDVDNFDFLNSLQVFVSSSRAGTTLPRRLVAESNPVPTGLEVLPLQTTGADIKPHIEEGALIEATAMGTVPPDDVTFVGSLTFTIDVL